MDSIKLLESVTTDEVKPKRPRVPFNRPYVTGDEFGFIQQAINNAHLSGNGQFTQRCQKWLEAHIGSHKAFLTHSGTAALEMAAILAKLEPGDEVIMPSFTFVTTASAFVLRGAVPVFVDIRPDILNIDETLIERAITEKTRAIVPVHYAGVSCDMNEIMRIARKHKLLVIEDAAHAVMASSGGRPVGCRGDFTALSFHETKNIIAGEGGALLVNNQDFVDDAYIVWEKGTNRREFFLGQTDKYTWKELGSSFPASELMAAFLWAQISKGEDITKRRVDAWKYYHKALEPLEKRGVLRRPTLPPDCEINGHIYFVLLESRERRDRFLEILNSRGINCVFHYIPLHSSPAGERFGKCSGDLNHTEDLSGRLARLPLWPELTKVDLDLVVAEVFKFFDE